MTTHTVRLAGTFGKHDVLEYPGAAIEIDDKGNLLLIAGESLLAAWPHGEWASIMTEEYRPTAPANDHLDLSLRREVDRAVAGYL